MSTTAINHHRTQNTCTTKRTTFLVVLWRSLVVLSCIGPVTVVRGSRLPLEVFTHRPDHHLNSGHGARLHHHFSQHHTEHHHDKEVHRHNEGGALRVLYQVGNTEESLPLCAPRAVCSKIDLYDSESPWIERQCRCPNGGSGGDQDTACPASPTAADGRTLVDKTRLYKLCEPVRRLPKCRYFRDTTWTLTTLPEANLTQQVVHCHCPRNAVTYLIRRQRVGETAPGLTDQQTPDQQTTPVGGYQYEFACSPQSRLRCQRKEPCRLFTVRKRQEFLDEVNTSTLCQCPREHRCPRHHTDPGSIPGKSYTEEAIRTYSGYCMPS